MACWKYCYINDQLNKSWQQHPTRHQLYGHLPPTTKTVQVRQTRHAGHCWRSRDELISDILLWTLAYGRTKEGRPARTYIWQLCKDTGCSPEDLPEAMNDRKKWRERVRDIHAGGTTWWWWWWFPNESNAHESLICHYMNDINQSRYLNCILYICAFGHNELGHFDSITKLYNDPLFLDQVKFQTFL